jgi:hypothetical protein
MSYKLEKQFGANDKGVVSGPRLVEVVKAGKPSTPEGGVAAILGGFLESTTGKSSGMSSLFKGDRSFHES